jgi:hypothetical protein
LEQIVYRQPPTWHGRLSFGQIITAIDRRPVRSVSAIDADDFVVAQIYIPDNQCTGSEIVALFRCDLALGLCAIIVFAADSDGEDRRAFKNFMPDDGPT